jgi:hypothetical protein
VPLMISLVTSVVGAAPLGTATVGLVASGPLVGVLAATVGVVGVVLVGVVSPLACGTELTSDSLPTPIELELLLDPQPAISAVVASVATTMPIRRARERARVDLGGCG